MNLTVTLSNTKAGLHLTDTNHGDATQIIIRFLQTQGIYGVNPTMVKMPSKNTGLKGVGYIASKFELEDGEGESVTVTITEVI